MLCRTFYTLSIKVFHAIFFISLLTHSKPTVFKSDYPTRRGLPGRRSTTFAEPLLAKARHITYGPLSTGGAWVAPPSAQGAYSGIVRGKAISGRRT